MTSSQARRLLGFKRLVERVAGEGCLITGIPLLLWVMLMLLSAVVLLTPSWRAFEWWTTQLVVLDAIVMFMAVGVVGACLGITLLLDDVLLTRFPCQGQVVVGRRISQQKAWQLVHTRLPAGTFVLVLEFQDALDSEAGYYVHRHLIESPRTWVIASRTRYFLATKIRENQQDDA